MGRKRERFERTDVPEPSPLRNVIGGVVAAAAIIATVAIVMVAWNRASLESRMGDHALSSAISELAQTSLGDSPEGYSETGSELNLTLLLTASNLEPSGATLSDARILSVNATEGTATLVSVPTDLALMVDGEQTTLGELFSSRGYGACVAPLGRTAGLRFDNVILATEDVLEEAVDLAGSGVENLVRSASDFLEKIRTNMDAPTLLSFADTLSAVGVEGLEVTEAPLTAETVTDEDGNVTETGRQTLDRGALGVIVGRLVAA